MFIKKFRFQFLMPSETFSLANEKEELLHGIIETDQPRKKQPAVIFLNGLLGTAESPWRVKLAEKLRKLGFVTVRFDYAYGFGQGSGDPSKFTLGSQVADAQRVLEHTLRRSYVNDNVALIGHCFGGAGALLMAAFEERITALVIISTPYQMTDTRVTRFDEREMSRIRLKRYFHMCANTSEVRVDYAFFEDAMKKDMARATRNIKQPILIMHGEQDESIPMENSQEIFDRIHSEKQLKMIKGMGHQMTGTPLKQTNKLITEFLQKQFQSKK